MTLTERVAAVARRLDDDALAALANRGLARRARKDVDARPPVVRGERDGAVEVEVEEHVVRLVETPGDARCTCPSGRACRHVLAAWIAAGGAADAAPTEAAPVEAAPAEAAPAVDVDALKRWAGAALLRRADEAVGAGEEVRFSTEGGWRARLVARGEEVRAFGPSLGALLCTCHAPGACFHRAVAVVAWLARTGARAPEPPSVAPSLPGAVRTPEEVRLAVLATCEGVVARGLGRAGAADRERLRALAASSHGADLPRLERACRAAADAVDGLLGRLAGAGEDVALRQLAALHALARALAEPTPALVGRHRRRYEDVAALELVGAGARTWRAASGYVGVTVLFWEPAAERWSTWTDARPADQAFDPHARFGGPGPWPGLASPRVAAASRLRLVGGARSGDGRLSGQAEAALRLGPATAADLPAATTRWASLGVLARRVFARGLSERGEGDDVVVLAPAGLGPARFDTASQALVRALFDEEGRPLDVVAPHRPGSGDGAAVEEWTSAPDRLVGRLRLRDGRLCVESWAAADGAGVVPLGTTEPGPEGDADDHAAPPLGGVARVVSAAMDALEVRAAAGSAALLDATVLEHAAADAGAAGLLRLEAALRSVLAAERAAVAGRVLAAAWVAALTMDAVAVERAV